MPALGSDIERCFLFAELNDGEKKTLRVPVSQLLTMVRVSEWNSEDPGSNPPCLFFAII